MKRTADMPRRHLLGALTCVAYHVVKIDVHRTDQLLVPVPVQQRMQSASAPHVEYWSNHNRAAVAIFCAVDAGRVQRAVVEHNGVAGWDRNGHDGVLRAVLGDVLLGCKAARVQDAMLVAARNHSHATIGLVGTIDGGPDVYDGRAGRKRAWARRHVLMPRQRGGATSWLIHHDWSACRNKVAIVVLVDLCDERMGRESFY